MTIQGMPRTEESIYRALDKDSSSSLKVFADNRRKYVKIFIDHLKDEDDDNQDDNGAIRRGKIVEALLLEPDSFDLKFYLSACAKMPSGLGLAFVNALYKYTVECMDESGQITRSFEDISKDAYRDAGYKLPYEGIISKFLGSDSEIYFNELLNVKINNLIVVTTFDITMAEKIVEQLKNSYVTDNIVTLESSQNFTVMKQLQIDNYTIDGHPMKSMIDLVIANHRDRILSPFDLKCTWSVENFYENYFLFRKAYIQAFVYYRACLSLCLDVESEFYGYTVEPTQFIVCDSGAFYEPLIYKLTIDDLNDAYTGFEYKGRTYIGVHDIISNLQFCLEHNLWNISRDNYLNRGIVSLKS